MKVIEKRIHEMLEMEREDLLSRKVEVRDRYLLARFGKKRKKKGGKGGKGKKGKKR